MPQSSVYFKDQLNLSCNELLKTTNAKTIFLFYSLQLIFKKSMATGKKRRKNISNMQNILLKQMFCC